MSYADEPASPQHGVMNEAGNLVSISEWTGEVGLTRREQFCLAMNVAETGDDELDAIIIKGNKQRHTADIIAAVIAGVYGNCPEYEYQRWGLDYKKKAVFIATSLILELEKINVSN